MPDDPRDELYGLDPKDFVAARNDLAKRLRKEGDKALAAEVAKLKRPSPAAWAVNQLARRHRADLEELVRLGGVLRAAQEGALSGAAEADLRQAGRARREAVSRLAGMAEALFDERGGGGAAHAGDVGATLEAASLDAEAGAAVLAGRLTEDMRPPSGFGVFDDAGPAPPRAERPRPASEPETAEPDERAERARREAEDAAAEARRRWEERSTVARTAVDLVAERRRAVEEAEAEIGRLEDELEAAGHRRREAVREAQLAEDAASRAEDSTDRAAKELRDAEQRVQELGVD